MMNVMHANTGIILVPDNCKLADEDVEERLLVAANYNADTEEDKQKIEELFTSNESGFVQNLANQGIEIDGMTRISLYESSVGLATIVNIYSNLFRYNILNNKFSNISIKAINRKLR